MSLGSRHVHQVVQPIVNASEHGLDGNVHATTSTESVQCVAVPMEQLPCFSMAAAMHAALESSAPGLPNVTYHTKPKAHDWQFLTGPHANIHMQPTSQPGHCIVGNQKAHAEDIIRNGVLESKMVSCRHIDKANEEGNDSSLQIGSQPQDVSKEDLPQLVNASMSKTSFPTRPPLLCSHGCKPIDTASTMAQTSVAKLWWKVCPHTFHSARDSHASNPAGIPHATHDTSVSACSRVHGGSHLIDHNTSTMATGNHAKAARSP